MTRSVQNGLGREVKQEPSLCTCDFDRQQQQKQQQRDWSRTSRQKDTGEDRQSTMIGKRLLPLLSPSPMVMAVVVVVVVLMCADVVFGDVESGNETSGAKGVQGNVTSLSEHATKREKVIQDLLRKHDATIPPNYEDNFPTEVEVQIFLVSFDSISEATMDYSVTIFLRQKWNDSRLAYPPLAGIKALELDTRVMQRLWVPDLFFTNEKRADFHDVTVPNRLMHVFPEGQVLYSIRISMKLSCDMKLWKFPFDGQVCHISMESYGYSAENIIFKWTSDPVQRRQNMSLPQFTFEDYRIGDCNKSYLGTQYSCIKVEFDLLRSYGYYMAQVYIPSVLVVVLSWVSFWLDIDAVPARISLGLLTVLTMTTQGASARSNLPRVSYVKAIDVWMAMCLIFVFAALIEFAYVNVNARVEKRRQSVHGGLKLGVSGQGGDGGLPRQSSVNESGDEGKNGGRKRLFSKTTVMRQRARALDKISRVAFPAVFIIFNALYWSIYMILDD